MGEDFEEGLAQADAPGRVVQITVRSGAAALAGGWPAGTNRQLRGAGGIAGMPPTALLLLVAFNCRRTAA